MFVELDIKVNLGDLQKIINSSIKEERLAVTRALNKVAAQVKVAAAREIQSVGYSIKISDIKRSIEIRRATQSRDEVVLISTGRPIPLLAYGARQVSTGVSVTVKEGRKIIKGAFIATMKNGHRGVFTRKPGTMMGKRGKLIVNRQIQSLYGPSIPSALADPIVMAKLFEMVKEKFPKLLKHELKFIQLAK